MNVPQQTDQERERATWRPFVFIGGPWHGDVVRVAPGLSIAYAYDTSRPATLTLLDDRVVVYRRTELQVLGRWLPAFTSGPVTQEQVAQCVLRRDVAEVWGTASAQRQPEPSSC